MDKDLSFSNVSVDLSVHLEIISHKPVLIVGISIIKTGLAPFCYDLSRSYSFKMDEPFGNGIISLKIKN
jgi:hypothetical protein